ncbi:MAG: hypothetical protein K6G27_11310 [Lachnospiraceae bacterium]|nr:hypothetical protein [Lachnospiraceae bacterium]
MKGRKIISLCMAIALASAIMIIPTAEVKAANSQYDQAVVRQIIWDFYRIDYYDQVHAAAINKWRDLVNKGASQKAIANAWNECVAAANNRIWAQSQATDLMNRAIASGNPTKYIDNLIPKDPSLMTEPTSWAMFTNKSKYDNAWKERSYSHSELVNQAAYNGIIGQVGAYSIEQGNINAVNEYRQSSLP